MHIKKILSDFASWILIGLTFLGLIIIYAGIGEVSSFNVFENINWYFVGVGLVLIFPCAFYIIRAKLLFNKATDENIDRINKLIKTGDKLIIDLDTLEIKTNNYKQEVSIGSGYQEQNVHVDVNHNLILLEVPYQNEVIKYELNINMELTKLRMHFAVKGETYLYVDSQNPNNSYLDLSFLES